MVSLRLVTLCVHLNSNHLFMARKGKGKKTFNKSIQLYYECNKTIIIVVHYKLGTHKMPILMHCGKDNNIQNAIEANLD